MADLKLFEVITDPVVINTPTSFPQIGVKFWQASSSKRYYRIHCVANIYSPPNFQDFYLYLGDKTTSPNYNYTTYFSVQRINTSSTFGDIFSRYTSLSNMRCGAVLQSSPVSDFSSGVVSSTENHLIDFKLAASGWAPEWSSPITRVDTNYANNAGIQALTGSDQKAAQRLSKMEFTIPNATAKASATIDKYIIKFGSLKTWELTPQQLSGYSNKLTIDFVSEFSKVNSNYSVTVSVEDSRGLTRTGLNLSPLIVVPYSVPIITNNDTHRQGGVGSTLIFDFEGEWQGNPLTLTCNYIRAYEEGSSTVYASFVPTISVSGNSFSFSDPDGWTGVFFDPKKAYTIKVSLSDTASTVILDFSVDVATPVMSIRDAKVGINNPSPSGELDVNGTIVQNEFPVLGFKGFIGDGTTADLNDYTETGYYVYRAQSGVTVSNFPGGNVNTDLIVMVIKVTGPSSINYVIQKAWQPSAGNEYYRTQPGGWNTWKKVTTT